MNVLTRVSIGYPNQILFSNTRVNVWQCIHRN